MPAGKSWVDNLRERFEIFISGRAPSDPLYLSNRTWKQKLRLVGLIALPIVILGVLIAIGATDPFHLIKGDPYEHPLRETAPKRVSAPLPDPKLVPKDLDVIDLRVEMDAKSPVVTGVVRNNTGQPVASAEVTYYLADGTGSLMGSESATVKNVAPHDSITFREPLKTSNAKHVIVRDVVPN